MTKKYDIVVFGATGFTGKHVVEEMSHVAKKENLQWAVAGRTMAKLQEVLSKAQLATGLYALVQIPFFFYKIKYFQATC